MFALWSNDVLGYGNDEYYCKFGVNLFLHNILYKIRLNLK